MGKSLEALASVFAALASKGNAEGLEESLNVVVFEVASSDKLEVEPNALGWVETGVPNAGIVEVASFEGARLEKGPEADLSRRA